MRHASALLVLFAALAAMPAAGEPAPAPPATPDIVVTGKTEPPPAPKDVYDQARDITRVPPNKLYEVALPRFAAPLCPGVLGLTTRMGQAMADRMRADVARVHLRLAPPGCSPNLLVAFVDKGQATLSELLAHHPGLFSQVAESEQQELLSEDSPVHVWNNIAIRWTGAGRPPPGWPKEKASVWGQLNRMSMPEAYDIRATLVLFDREAVLGMSLAQLADYATMRGLTHTRPPPSADQPMATILALFAGDRDKAPGELTRFDIAYLRGLYSEAANDSAVSKLLAVRREAKKDEAKD